MNTYESEFQKLYKNFQPKILRYLIRMVGKQEAEDVTQDVFIKVCKGLRNFRGDSQISTWIYRIATNAAIDRLRSPSFSRVVRTDLSSDPGIEDQTDIENKDGIPGETPPSAETSFVRKEMNECIRNFIDKLPEDYRTVVVLSELEELKNGEIADILGISLDTVKIRLHRARIKLKKELQENCSFYRNSKNELSCDLQDVFKGFRKEN